MPPGFLQRHGPGKRQTNQQNMRNRKDGNFLSSLSLRVAVVVLVSSSCAASAGDTSQKNNIVSAKSVDDKRESTALRAHKSRRLNEGDYSYKTYWSECSIRGNELSGEECKKHIELDLIEKNHILQDFVEVNLLRDQDLMSQPNEVLIRTNRHGDVIGGNSSSIFGEDSSDPPVGMVHYEFERGGENVDPFDCLGLSYSQCCLLVQSQTESSQEAEMTCREEVVYPHAIADAATDEVWFQEYIYNKAKNQIQMVHHLSHPENIQMNINVMEGSDGKVHTNPKVDLQVIHQPPPAFAFTEIIAEASAASTIPSVDTLQQTVMHPTHPGGGQSSSAAEEFLKGASSSVTQWWYGIPFGFLAFSVCFCCTALYVLCCIPIKDEDYLKDSEKVLENVREKSVDEDDVRSEPSGKKVKRATSSSRIL